MSQWRHPTFCRAPPAPRVPGEGVNAPSRPGDDSEQKKREMPGTQMLPGILCYDQ